jgi:uncharacterized protein
MTATTEAGARIRSLDVLRGIAVLGILAMNIIAFAMPFQAYMHPPAYGGTEGLDYWSWALSFVFIDGKMRALFSILFGASMLLVVDRAVAAGRSGASVHYRRMAWLLVFGLIHFFLIWFGDILTAYAVIGMIAYLFARKSARALRNWALGLFALSTLAYAVFFLSPLVLEAAANAPDARAELVENYRQLKADMGGGTPEALAADVARFSQGSWLEIVAYTLRERAGFLVQSILMFGPETLALMLLGMWGLRSGFLTGAWEAQRLRRMAMLCLGISVPVYALLAFAITRAEFALFPSLAMTGFAAALVRPVMALGYAALIVLIVQRTGAAGALGSRIAAAGRAAFTNYLGTSIVATFIFYGWGLGLYGSFSRAELWIVVVGIWALMLLWSKPWLERNAYGPLEWLWRSLARGSFQPMRRLPDRQAAVPAE